MFGIFEFVNHWSHIVVLNDLIKMLFVLVTVVDCKGDSLFTESTCSSNSVKVCFLITLLFFFILWPNLLLSWYIEINNKFSFRNINTPSYHVSTNKSMDFLPSETCHGFISFLFIHFTKHNIWRFSFLSQHSVDCISKIFSIYENERLSSIHFIKYLFQEVNFSWIFWDFVCILSNMIKFKFGCNNFNLLSWNY